MPSCRSTAALGTRFLPPTSITGTPSFPVFAASYELFLLSPANA